MLDISAATTQDIALRHDRLIFIGPRAQDVKARLRKRGDLRSQRRTAGYFPSSL